MATRGSSAWRTAAWGEAPEDDIVGMAIYAGGPRFQCARDARPAMTALGGKFQAHGYIIRRAGGFNPRPITGGTAWSSHAWGISIDVNDDTNPYRRDRLVTDMLGASGRDYRMIEDVYSIRTIDGIQVFRWGGDWDGRPETSNSNYDAMHFEIIATRAELKRGILAVPAATAAISSGAPVVLATHYPVIRRGAIGPVVAELQMRLGMARTTGTGTFGPRTHEAVVTFQRSRGLDADGIVGAATWTALLTGQPPLAPGVPRPQKIKHV